MQEGTDHEYNGIDAKVTYLYLYMCNNLSATDRDILHHVIRLSDRYREKGGCNLSNAELAEINGVSEQTVSNTIAKAKELGWVSKFDLRKIQIGEGKWANRRYIIIEPQIEWVVMGLLFSLAYYHPDSHPFKKEAKQIVREVREFGKNLDGILQIQHISKFIGRSSQPIKKFIVSILNNNKYRISVLYSKELSSSDELFTPDNDACNESDVAPTKSRVRRKLNMKSKDVVDPNALLLIEFWNQQPNLMTHKLVAVGRRTKRYPLSEQSKTIVKINDIICKVIGKNFYSSRTELKGIKKLRGLKPAIGQVRQAIKRMNMLASSEYNEGYKTFAKYSFDKFFYNPHGIFKAENPETTKFKYRYPLLHNMLNKPKRIADRAFTAKTKYKRAVTLITTEFKGTSSFKGTEREYNEVVKHVETAARLIKQTANGTSDSILSDLGPHILDCMRTNGGTNFDKMFMTVTYKLIPYLRERRYI